MDGLIYYPTIELPDDEWTTRTLLYWDSVATIVPPSVISEPDKMSSFNRELVLTELVRQLPVADMDGESYRLVSIASREFVRFLQQLDTAEIARRRSAFTAGSTTVLYTAKATGEAIDELQRLAITEQGAIHDRDSVAVEKATVRDYLAVLACSFARELSATPGNRWVIGTRSEDAMTSLILKQAFGVGWGRQIRILGRRVSFVES
ncbi:MAG: hypothetical protein M3256_16380 [Actinomycetota bacterium]|nr:hypothetical protein [Actinomycetota bacterium]